MLPLSDAPDIETIRLKIERTRAVFEGRAESDAARRLLEHIRERPDADELVYDIRHKCDNALTDVLELVYAIRDACDNDEDVTWMMALLPKQLEFINAVYVACAHYPESLDKDWVYHRVPSDAGDGDDDPMEGSE